MYNTPVTAIDTLKLTDKRQEISKIMGFDSAEDILEHYPSRYEVNYLNKKEEFIKGARVTFKGKVIGPTKYIQVGFKRSVVRFKCIDQNDQELNCTVFNRPWAYQQIKEGHEVIVIGTVDGPGRINVVNYYIDKDIKDILGIKPIYPVKADVTQAMIKSLIKHVRIKMRGQIEDDIPLSLRKEHGLISREEAINYIHEPKNADEYKRALSRLKYEEFLNFYLALYMRQVPTSFKKAKSFSLDKINELISGLPFKLTKDQLSVIKEILIDLKSDRLMMRLVQGDVGSGKTIVAIIALYANYLAGYQGAMMAPTEILAKQHFTSVSELLAPLGVNVALLSSSTKERKVLIKRLEDGDIDIIVGTHALFSDDVKMGKLGLVITDEQHRFGVNQRKRLLAKGDDVDFLLMSATPIPRTLASAIYGDMAISSIYTMPSGRKGCDTLVIYQNKIDLVEGEIKKVLREGRQVYIIASAIDKSEVDGMVDAISLYEKLKRVFDPYVTGLLHGRLTNAQKDVIMDDFAQNKIQVLVTTTVVEVGVNVPNATCMVVYNAERFGLSQLHQLRGRIQRSNYKGRFFLLCDGLGEDVKKRLDVLANTSDGFRIAEEDLKLRGPGDLLGTRQSGLPSFVLGDLLNDRMFIDAAQRDAHMILANSDRDEYQKIIAKAKQNISDSLG